MNETTARAVSARAREIRLPIDGLDGAGGDARPADMDDLLLELREARILMALNYESWLCSDPRCQIAVPVPAPKDQWDRYIKLRRKGQEAIEWWLDASDEQRAAALTTPTFLRAFELHVEIMALRSTADPNAGEEKHER